MNKNLDKLDKLQQIFTDEQIKVKNLFFIPTQNTVKIQKKKLFSGKFDSLVKRTILVCVKNGLAYHSKITEKM